MKITIEHGGLKTTADFGDVLGSKPLDTNTRIDIINIINAFFDKFIQALGAVQSK